VAVIASAAVIDGEDDIFQPWVRSDICIPADCAELHSGFLGPRAAVDVEEDGVLLFFWAEICWEAF